MSEKLRCRDCHHYGLAFSNWPCSVCVMHDELVKFKPKQEDQMRNLDSDTPAKHGEIIAVTEEQLINLAHKIGAVAPPLPPETSATDAVAKIMEYSHPLYEAFDDAVKQATKGKGERHGGDKTPFMDQPWHNISKHTGVGGLIFQMVKKAQEACGKEDQEAFEREFLGALVYGGAAYLYVKQHGFKQEKK